jgi:hypothetical protein
MPDQYVREPLTDAEADRLANACETPTEPLILWTLLDTGPFSLCGSVGMTYAFYSVLETAGASLLQACGRPPV